MLASKKYFVAKSSKNRKSKGIGSGGRGKYTQTYLKENNISKFPRSSKCIVPRTQGPFPDVYGNTMKTSVESLLNGGVVVSDTYVINGPAHLFGPQRNFAGAFAANYPAGIDWLLATTNVLGSTAPYRFLTVINYRFEFEISNTSTVGARVCIFPSMDPSFLAMPISNVGEQKGTVQLEVSPSSLGGPFRCRLEGSCSELFGVAAQEYYNDTDYVQIVGAVPSRPCFMHVICTSLDGTNISVYTRITAYLDIKFGGLNPMGTAGPTLQMKQDGGLHLVHQPVYVPKWDSGPTTSKREAEQTSTVNVIAENSGWWPASR